MQSKKTHFEGAHDAFYSVSHVFDNMLKETHFKVIPCTKVKDHSN